MRIAGVSDEREHGLLHTLEPATQLALDADPGLMALDLALKAFDTGIDLMRECRDVGELARVDLAQVLTS